MSELDAKIVESARRYQEAEKAARCGKGSLENEYARRRELYRLLDERFGVKGKNDGR